MLRPGEAAVAEAAREGWIATQALDGRARRIWQHNLTRQRQLVRSEEVEESLQLRPFAMVWWLPQVSFLVAVGREEAGLALDAEHNAIGLDVRKAGNHDSLDAPAEPP